MKTVKQTAANNRFLANVKERMNVPIYKSVSRILNAEGEAAAATYLKQFFRADVADVSVASFRIDR